MLSRERWEAMWQALGATRVAPGLYDEVLARYAEPQRHYHTVQHLDECFAQLELARGLAAHPAEVELALWFHDAIYEPRRSDNELKSADWVRASALAAGAPDAAGRVHALVMATRHEAMPQGPDEEVLIDVDLSILGAAPERFDEYERQVREEYAWVPAFVYRRNRKDVLRQFLARPAIFSTRPFHERLEAPARANLERSIARL